MVLLLLLIWGWENGGKRRYRVLKGVNRLFYDVAVAVAVVAVAVAVAVVVVVVARIGHGGLIANSVEE